MNCLQFCSRGRNLILGSLNELLVATIQQSTHFPLHQDARTDRERRRSTLSRYQHGAGSMFAHQRSARGSGKGRDFKIMGAQLRQRLFESRMVVGMAGFSGHARFPVSRGSGTARHPHGISNLAHRCRRLQFPEEKAALHTAALSIGEAKTLWRGPPATPALHIPEQSLHPIPVLVHHKKSRSSPPANQYEN